MSGAADAYCQNQAQETVNDTTDSISTSATDMFETSKLQLMTWNATHKQQ
jgi:hypothetical protein